MIPDIRLMIVALLASIVAISCGLGLFAAFRVNNEQFVRAPNGSPLLRLAFVAPMSVTDATVPIAVRLRMNTPAAVAEPAKPIAAIELASAPTAASPDTGPETSQPAGKDGSGDVAAVPPADQSPPAEPDAKSGPSAPSAETTPTAKAMKKMTRYRAVKLHRRVQPQGATAAQPGDQFGALSQPAFQSPAQAAAPQTVRRRLVVKRRRPANTTAATTAVPRQAAAAITSPR
jgi:hypothetical protein